jgi:hypothetical protein
MKARTICALGAAVLLAGLQPVFSQSRERLQALDELDRKCEAARDAILPAIIEWKIQQCVKVPPSPRARPRTLEQCQAYWSDFGEMQRQRAALDIDECHEAYAARQAHRSRTR